MTPHVEPRHATPPLLAATRAEVKADRLHGRVMFCYEVPGERAERVVSAVDLPTFALVDLHRELDSALEDALPVSARRAQRLAALLAEHIDDALYGLTDLDEIDSDVVARARATIAEVAELAPDGDVDEDLFDATHAWAEELDTQLRALLDAYWDPEGSLLAERCRQARRKLAWYRCRDLEAPRTGGVAAATTTGESEDVARQAGRPTV
jgi:hypothetical protein